MPSPRVVARIQNLLALASPDSNTTDAERAVAAAMVEEMLAKHGLNIEDVPQREMRRRPRPPVKRAPAPEPEPEYRPPPAPVSARWSGSRDYQHVIIVGLASCVSCGKFILHNEDAWYNSERGYIHFDIGCY